MVVLSQRKHVGVGLARADHISNRHGMPQCTCMMSMRTRPWAMHWVLHRRP